MRITRRGLLAGTAAGTVWTAIGAVPAGAADLPPGFPSDVELERRRYRNWAGEIVVDAVPTCVPNSAAQVVEVANWAVRNGYRVRARGRMHGWSPLTVSPGDDPDRLLLVDTTRYLTSVRVGVDGVTAQAGATLDAVLEALRDNGLGVASAPAPGDITVGGVLAIGAHGTAVPAVGETPVPGQRYGSVSNLVRSLTAVVWDGDRYVTRTYTRDDADTPALLTNLGRVFVTEAELSAGTDRMLRCLSRVDIPADELFGTTGRTMARYLAEAGRVEAIWYPYTEYPWLKVWSVAPHRPLTARHTTRPYNYPFSDRVPEPVAELFGRLIGGEWYLAPAFGAALYEASAVGLVATASADLWGRSADLIRYVKPSTLRVSANGYAALVPRADAQRVIGDFTTEYRRLLRECAAAGRYPMNGPVEIRVTATDSAMGGAAPPLLSGPSVDPAHPERDTVVWLDALTVPGTPDAFAFYRDLESFVVNRIGGYATVRPEWSKGWAYTATAGWADGTFLSTTIPSAFGAGWHTALGVLGRLDPHRVFANAFLDALAP